MKKICVVLFLFLGVTAALTANQEQKVKYRIKQTEVKPLSQIGEVNLEAIAMLKGQWLIQESRFVLEFTDHFACRIDGLAYYHYKRVGTNPGYPYLYTIVKSKDTGHYFFARGYYKDKRLFGNTSKIELNGDYILVYSDKNQGEIYFKALRIKEPAPGAKETPKE